MATNNNDSNLFQPQMPLFKGENYDFWSIKMKTLFISQDLWDLVENGYTEPADEQALATWTQTQRDQLKENIKKDSKALFIIQQAVHESIFPRIAATTKSKQAWELLRNTFQGIEKESQLMPMSSETKEWLREAKSDLYSVSLGYDKSTCIFSAPKELLKEYEDAYVPRIVSIGPYHFGKQELKEMESFKSDAVRRELARIRSKTCNSEFRFDQVIEKILGMVGQILCCYDKDIPYDAEVVCWMMARDACFILEFYRGYIWQIKDTDKLFADDEDFQFRETLHPIFGLESENHVVKSEIMRDLIKLENQVPLFVLEEVLAMEQFVAMEEEASYPERLGKAKSKLQILLNAVFHKIYYRPFEYCANVPQSPSLNHILDIYYYCCLGDVTDFQEQEEKKHVHRICFRDVQDSKEPEEKRKGSKFLSAVELNNGGVTIQAKGQKVEDVNFEGGTLSIPQIKFNMDSEVYIRNLIALEICSPYGYSQTMTPFAQFMNELCQTEKGAALMREKGVIVGNLWQHSQVTRFFSSCKHSPLMPKHHSIERTRKKLIKYSSRTCRIGSGKMKKEFANAYFLKPWLLFGGIVGFLVFLLTATQVYCAFRSCLIR